MKICDHDKRRIKTRFGQIEVGQDHLLANSGGDFGISPYLQEIECYYGQNEIYESGSEALEKLLHIPMNKKQIERVTKHYGECLEKELEKESLEQLPRSVEKDEQVYAMIDGSMIFTRLGEWKEVKLGRIFSSKVLYSVSSRRNWIQDSFYVAHGPHEWLLAKAY